MHEEAPDGLSKYMSGASIHEEVWVSWTSIHTSTSEERSNTQDVIQGGPKNWRTGCEYTGWSEISGIVTCEYTVWSEKLKDCL